VWVRRLTQDDFDESAGFMSGEKGVFFERILRGKVPVTCTVAGWSSTDDDHRDILCVHDGTPCGRFFDRGDLIDDNHRFLPQD